MSGTDLRSAATRRPRTAQSSTSFLEPRVAAYARATRCPRMSRADMEVEMVGEACRACREPWPRLHGTPSAAPSADLHSEA
eukprot:887751-Rhodomonas_salina.1